MSSEMRTVNRENQETAQFLACNLRERVIEIGQIVNNVIHQVARERGLLDTKPRPWEIELKSVSAMLDVLGDQLIRLEMTIQWLHEMEGADELIQRALHLQQEEFARAKDNDNTARPGLLESDNLAAGVE